jgi:hypothetical protein
MRTQLTIGNILSELSNGHKVQCDFVNADNRNDRIRLEFGHDVETHTLYTFDPDTLTRLFDFDLANCQQPLKWMTIGNTENYSIA